MIDTKKPSIELGAFVGTESRVFELSVMIRPVLVALYFEALYNTTTYRPEFCPDRCVAQ